MNILITGGSRGLGLELAKAFIKNNDNVLICARNEIELHNAWYALSQLTMMTKGRIEYYQCDISQDAQKLFKYFIDIFGVIDVLINNAAIYGELGKLEDIDFQNWKNAIGVNLLASVYLTKLVIPDMKKNGGGKIIQLSGGGATSSLSNMSAYAISKAALVRFVECMAMELEGTNIFINAVAPGIMKTSLIDQVLENKDKVDNDYYENIKNYKDYNFSDPVNLIMWLASNKSDGISGKLISAKWDKWEEMDKHKDEIMKSNVYTLRRVTGQQAGFEWDRV